MTELTLIILIISISTVVVITMYIFKGRLQKASFENKYGKVEITTGLSLPYEQLSYDIEFFKVNSFQLNAKICRNLKLIGNQNNILGKDLYYIEKKSELKTTLIFLHGLGLNYNDFQLIMNKSKYNCIAPSLYGFNKGSKEIISLSYKQHLKIIEEFIDFIVSNKKEGKVYLVGFSLGGDMALDIVGNSDKLKDKIDGVITLDCNINLSTCDISKAFSNLPEEENELLIRLNEIGATPLTFEKWIYFHEYLSKVFKQFKGRIEVLSDLSKEVIENYQTKDEFDYFIDNLSNVVKKRIDLKCVFGNSQDNKNELNKLNTAYINNKLKDNDFDFSIINSKDLLGHFELIDNDKIEYLDNIIDKFNKNN